MREIGIARGSIRLIGPVLVPVLIGVTMGAQWPDAGENFYASAAQVIATLFIAIAVEFFAREAAGESALDRLRLVLLIALSWLGFFACLRALAGDPGGTTTGLAGAGVTAASVLVALTLYDEIRKRNEDSLQGEAIGQLIVVMFLAASVAVFFLP
jgi:hypothetical protein